MYCCLGQIIMLCSFIFIHPFTFMYMYAVIMIVLLPLPIQCAWFWHRQKENVKLMSALHGNTHLLGLRDNQFTWQHRAKNIWTALKITNKKREGELCLHTPIFVGLKMALQCWGRIKGVFWEKERQQQCVCFWARRIHGEEGINTESGAMMTDWEGGRAAGWERSEGSRLQSDDCQQSFRF